MNEDEVEKYLDEIFKIEIGGWKWETIMMLKMWYSL
jgi:hypothetical protein